MAKSDDLDGLPLPKSWPKLAKRALVLVNSMLKVSFDIELGLRLDCASHHAREHAEPERLRILELKALNGWTAVKTGELFLLDQKTVCRWMKELAEVGEERLLAIQPPVNKFPDFVDRIVAQMVVALPEPTKRKIATRLARAGCTGQAICPPRRPCHSASELTYDSGLMVSYALLTGRT